MWWKEESSEMDEARESKVKEKALDVDYCESSNSHLILEVDVSSSSDQLLNNWWMMLGCGHDHSRISSLWRSAIY